MRSSEQIKAEIEEKFGFFPPFFSPAEQNPQVLENLWQQTLSAYVNNPLSPLFKEKLAAYLSRYCAIPYCMICHSCSLRPLGMRAREVLQMLEAPPPGPTDMNAHLQVLAAHSEQLAVLSNWNSTIEESLLICAVFISLEGETADYYRSQLRHLLGTVNYQHLVSFIAYVKTCHVWMEAHPEVAYTADKRAIEHFSFLLGDEPELADFFHHYWERLKRERQSWAEQRAAIAERQQHEAALRQSEERLSLALEAAHMGRWDWDILTNKVFHSVATEAHFGLTPGSFGGSYESFLASVHPDDRQCLHQAVMQAVQAGADYEIEFRVIWPDNSIHWVASKGQVYYDKTGKAVRMTGVTMDITERKQLFAHEQALRAEAEAARNQVANILESITDAFFAVDSQWCFTYLNQQAEQHLQRSRAELLGKNLWDELPEAVGSKFYEEYHKAVSQHISVEFEEFYQPLNTWFAVHAYPNQKGLSVFFQDINERKRVEEALRQSEEKFRNLVEQTSDWVWEIDTNGIFTYVSPKASEIIGYEIAEILGKSTFDLMSVNEVQRFTQVVSYFISTQQPFTRLEKTLTHKDGHLVVLETSGSPIFDCQGVFQGYRGIARDITERREIERLKDEFVSVVSHELRTPLTSIRGALGLLANGVLSTQPAKGQRMLDIALNNTDRLVRLINDILDIERIESGKVTMTRLACDAANLMINSADTMRDMAEKAGVTLSVSPVTTRLWADPDRIIQVLTNLLSNAIKFSPEGSTVWLTAELVRSKQVEQNSSVELLFQVKDSGRGIPADKLETIFGRFQQVDASDSRNKGGTGLGLAICRSIIQHHGGRIWAESTLGEGSTFYFTLPVLRSESAVAIADPSNPLVLVCDDDPSIRDVMQAMLEKQGYRALTVASGQAAIEQAVAQPPDAILLNLMMPGMHGWETLAILKQQPSTQKIPIIILSGLLPDATEVPHPGISDWLVKPPEQQQLFQALKRALSGSDRHIRVLVVEDDLDLAQVLIAMFERYGIETYYAQTGREAIQISQRVIPDLLVLDLVLPECNGFTVVDWLRQHNRLCQVALVVYTAKDLDDSDRERLKLGQTLFLTKSRVTTEEFERRVIKLLNRIICGSKEDTNHDSQTDFNR
ncbi:MAG: PAS domain S-box protein [Fischerella sp. CENA71]|nr:PAS domain S-box protein [Fischerella sp. CENA71]